MTTEFRSLPRIENVATFRAETPGVVTGPIMLIVAITESHEYSRARITQVSVLGSHAMTAHQAAALRDQLNEAITAVVASCPAMATPDEVEHLPRNMPRG